MVSQLAKPAPKSFLDKLNQSFEQDLLGRISHKARNFFNYFTLGIPPEKFVETTLTPIHQNFLSALEELQGTEESLFKTDAAKRLEKTLTQPTQWHNMDGIRQHLSSGWEQLHKALGPLVNDYEQLAKPILKKLPEKTLSADEEALFVNALKSQPSLNHARQFLSSHPSMSGKQAQINTFFEQLTYDIKRAVLKKRSASPLIQLFDNYERRTMAYADRFIEPMLHEAAFLKTHGIKGPVSRLLVSCAFGVKRILNGGAFAMAGSGWLMEASKAAMPFMMGIMLFGSTLGEARQAEPGEKLKVFAEGFISRQLGFMFFWELGLRALNALQTFDHLLGKNSFKRLPGILRFIPILGSFTAAGFATEMVGQIGFAWLGQSLFQKISWAIFGKPERTIARDKAEKDKDKAPESSAALASSPTASQASSSVVPGNTPATAPVQPAKSEGKLPQSPKESPLVDPLDLMKPFDLNRLAAAPA
jgi:hypothetical protein